MALELLYSLLLYRKHVLLQSSDELFIDRCLAEEAANKVSNVSNDMAKELAMKEVERERIQQTLVNDLVSTESTLQALGLVVR